MGIFAKLKSNSENNYLMSPKTAEKDKIIEFNMNTRDGSAEEREEGEIIDEFEDIISSDEEFSMRKRIEELEAKNAELEKIAKISVSAAYASGGYNDYPKKDSHHLDRYPPVLIDISDDEDYPPPPKMPRILKRRKSIQHSSSSRHKLLHSSSSNHRRRKRSCSPPPAPSYRQSDKLLLSLFHERVASHNSHSSKRKRKTKKQHSTKSFRGKSRENYVGDSDEDEYNYLESYNANDNHEHLNSSDRDKSYSLNRDELRLALARNTHRIEQHASLKDRLTRKKENKDKCNFAFTVGLDSLPQEAQEARESGEGAESGEAVVVEEEEQQEKPSSPPLPVEEKEQTDDNLEEQELRILALKSAVLKKHMVRKKRNENVAYSPSDFDEIYKCISESPSLNNIDGEEACNSMEISPVPSPKMVLSDDGGIDTKPVDMDIVNSDSECELPLCDKWIPIEQIPLPNSIGFNDQIYNPTPMRYNNNNYIAEAHAIPPDVRYESASISPKNFDSEVDEEEIALRALLLAKMNSPKVNKVVKKEPPKVVQVQSPDPDVSLEAETLRNFLINNMKKKSKPKNSSASVLKEAVRRLTGKSAPTEDPIPNSCPIKSADETEKELSQAIIDMANVNIGLESKIDIVKNVPSSGGIRVKNIETLRAPPKFEMNLDEQRRYSQQKNLKENLVVQIHQKPNDNEKIQPNKSDTIKVANKKALPAKQTIAKNVLKSVSSQNYQKENVSKYFSRNLTVKIEKMILPNASVNKNVPLKPCLGKKIAAEKASENVDCIDIKAQTISENSPNEEAIVGKVDPQTCVKTEQESNESNSEKELPPKAAVNQKNTDPKDAEDTPALNKVSDNTSKDQVAGILLDSKPVLEKSSEIDNSVNEQVEDVNGMQIKEIACDPLLEIKQQNATSDVAVKIEDATTNIKELNNSEELNIVDPKSMAQVGKKDSSNFSQSEDADKNVSPDKASGMPTTKDLLVVDSVEITEALISPALPSGEEANVQKLTEIDEVKCIEITSTVDILQETNVVKDESALSKAEVSKSETTTTIKSIPTSKVEVVNEKETSKSESSKKNVTAQNRQVRLGAKSLEIQVQRMKTVNAKTQMPLVSQNVYKLTNTQRVSEPVAARVEKPEISVIKNSLPTQNKIIPSTSNVIPQRPIAKLPLPNQQLITTRTKIVKPNKIINQQSIDLKRKNTDNLPQLPVATKKPKPDDTNRLITTAEIPKVPELVIQLRVSESESEYSDFSTHDMGEDEDSRVRNYFNQSITIGNEYHDIASPISLPMESPCDTPTRSRSPIVSSQSQTPQPSVEKSIVNDYFEAKLEQFLKNVRSKVSDTVSVAPSTKPTESKAPVNSTPVAVRHLPEASQQEYRRLINRMKMLERQKQAKNSQVLSKANDSSASDSKTTITDDGDSKFLVRKVLVKNASTKSSSSVINKPKIPEKTEATIEKASSPAKSVKSPEKIGSSVSPDGSTVKSARQNLLVLYENSYHKTGTSIICNLDKSIEMVMVAKNAKMAKLKCEQRLRELRKEMEDVQKSLKEQQEKITNIYPEICNSHRAIESLKTRRLKINKAVTALGKSVIGTNYSMKNDQKSIISEKSKKLAAEIKSVNSMKLSDVEKMEHQHRLNLPDNAKKVIAPIENPKSSISEEKLPTKSSSVEASENIKTSLETQLTEANSVPEEELPAHKNDMPSMPPSSSPPSPSPSSSPSAIIENEVPTCESQSPEILDKSVPENMENHITNNTIVPETFSKKDEEKACSTTTTNIGHEEALELEQPVVAVAVAVAVDGDNINNNEQALEQIRNMDDIVEEENGGEQVGSAKLQDYVSPLSHLRDERHINPNGVVCPYQLMGQCDDKDCKYMHLED